MNVNEFYTTGRVLMTEAYARRGTPLPQENGKRARWEHFEFGPYPARLGIVGEIHNKPFSWHTSVFEVDLGSHVVSALRTPVRDNDGRYLCEDIDWVDPPSDADIVAFALIYTNYFG